MSKGDSRLIRLVEERARNVPGAVAEEEDGVRDDLLRVACFAAVFVSIPDDFSCYYQGEGLIDVFTCRIRNLHTKNQDKRRVVGAR